MRHLGSYTATAAARSSNRPSDWLRACVMGIQFKQSEPNLGQRRD